MLTRLLYDGPLALFVPASMLLILALIRHGRWLLDQHRRTRRRIQDAARQIERFPG